MKKELLKFVVLLCVAIGSAPAYSAYWQWVKSPTTSNATADPSINWAEGMSPSSVNDSGRAMMARAAEARDDSSGAVTTTGSATAYLATSNQGFSSTPTDGQLFAFTAHVTSGLSPTLSVDGGTAGSIVSQPATFAPPGTLQAGMVYTVRWNTANNWWVLRDFYGQLNATVPLGGLLPYTATTAPNANFVFAAGQCLSTTTYATYWALLGSPGIGTCATGQFRIIDMSGTVPAGLDTMPPAFVATNRLTNLATGCGTAMTAVGARCANGFENHAQTATEMALHAHTAGISDPTHGHTASTTAQTLCCSDSLTYAGGIFSFTSGTVTVDAHATGVTVDGGPAGGTSTYRAGSGVAAPQVQPTIGVTYLLRVL